MKNDAFILLDDLNKSKLIIGHSKREPNWFYSKG